MTGIHHRAGLGFLGWGRLGQLAGSALGLAASMCGHQHAAMEDLDQAVVEHHVDGLARKKRPT